MKRMLPEDPLVDNIYVLQTGSDGEDSIIPFQQFQLEYNLGGSTAFEEQATTLVFFYQTMSSE